MYHTDINFQGQFSRLLFGRALRISLNNKPKFSKLMFIINLSQNTRENKCPQNLRLNCLAKIKKMPYNKIAKISPLLNLCPQDQLVQMEADMIKQIKTMSPR